MKNLNRRHALKALARLPATALGGYIVYGIAGVAYGDTNTHLISKTPIQNTTPIRGKNDMSVNVLISSTVKKDKLEKLMPFLAENLPNVRSFDGCMRVSVLMNQETGEMLLDEEWLSVEQHQKYIASIQESGILGQLASHFEAPPKIQYMNRVMI